MPILTKKVFNTIRRAKQVPAASAQFLGLKEIKGENVLEVRNEGGEETHIFISASIGKSWWDDTGITEQEVRDALATIEPNKQIRVHVNSEGGSVKEGLGIYNAFKERSGSITCCVDGYALSIASVIPLAAGKVISPKSAIWMIHEAWSWASGNKRDMEKQRAMLAEHDEMLAEIYTAVTGKAKDEIRKAMEDETWIRGSKAVEWGLADETDEEEDDAQARYPINQCWLDRCKNLSPEILNALQAGGNGNPSPASQASAVTPPASNNHPAPQGADQQKTKRQQTMNREQVIALLKKRGITVDDKLTDEQVFALLETEMNKPAPKEPGSNDTKDDNAVKSLAAEIVALKKAQDEAKKMRIEARLDSFIGETKLTKEERPKALARALADESYLDEIAARQPVQFGSEGVPFQSSATAGHFLDEINKEASAKKRCDIIKANWDDLLTECAVRDQRGERFVGLNRYNTRAALANPRMAALAGQRGMPLNANTYSATLVTAFLIDGAITKLPELLAPLKAFSRDFSTDPYKPRATGELKYVSAGGTSQKNALSFESGDATVDPVTISVDQYTTAAHVTNDELNSGLRMENMMVKKTEEFSKVVNAVALTPVTEANFANYNSGSYVSAPGAFGWSDMSILWGVLKKATEKHAILDGEYLGMLLNTPTFFQPGYNGEGNSTAKQFGWSGLHLNTNWSKVTVNIGSGGTATPGPGTGCRGFVCHPQAVGVIAGLPLTPPNVPGQTLLESRFTVPDVDLVIATYSWFSLASRTMWFSWDVMLGAKEADTSAGIFVKAS